MTPEQETKRMAPLKEILEGTGFYLCLDSVTHPLFFKTLKRFQANIRAIFLPSVEPQTLDMFMDLGQDKLKVVVYSLTDPEADKKWRNASTHRNAVFLGVTMWERNLYKYFSVNSFDELGACSEIIHPDNPDLTEEIGDILEEYYPA